MAVDMRGVPTVLADRLGDLIDQMRLQNEAQQQARHSGPSLSDRELGIKLSITIDKLGGNREKWLQFKTQLLNYVSLYRYTREMVAELVSNYKQNQTLPPAVVGMLFKKCLTSSLVGEKSFRAADHEDGFRAYIYLLDQYEPLTISRFMELVAKLWGGLNHTTNANVLFQEIFEINEHISGFGFTFQDKLLLIFALNALPAEFVNLRGEIAASTGVSFQEAGRRIDALADSGTLDKHDGLLPVLQAPGRMRQNQGRNGNRGNSTSGSNRGSRGGQSNGRVGGSRGNNRNGSAGGRNSQTPRSGEGRRSRRTPRTPETSTCLRYGEVGHFATECTKVPSTYRCSICGGNHLPSICKQQDTGRVFPS